MKKLTNYKSIFKESDFNRQEIKFLDAIFKNSGFSLKNSGEKEGGIFYPLFVKGREFVSIEEAIKNLQELKKRFDKTKYRVAIVQHLPSLRIDISD